MKGACTFKHYGFVMYVFCSELMCLYKLVKSTDKSKKSLAYCFNNFLYHRDQKSLMAFA